MRKQIKNLPKVPQIVTSRAVWTFSCPTSTVTSFTTRPHCNALTLLIIITTGSKEAEKVGFYRQISFISDCKCWKTKLKASKSEISHSLSKQSEFKDKHFRLKLYKSLYRQLRWKTKIFIKISRWHICSANNVSLFLERRTRYISDSHVHTRSQTHREQEQRSMCLCLALPMDFGLRHYL